MGQPSDSEADSVQMLQFSGRAEHAKAEPFDGRSLEHGARSDFQVSYQRCQADITLMIFRNITLDFLLYMDYNLSCVCI